MPLRDTQYRVRALLGALALGLAGCDSELPTAVADTLTPGVTILFDDPAGELTGRAATIRALVESTFARARVLIPVDGVTFTVIADPFSTIGGWGIGGFTLGASASSRGSRAGPPTPSGYDLVGATLARGGRTAAQLGHAPPSLFRPD